MQQSIVSMAGNRVPTRVVSTIDLRRYYLDSVLFEIIKSARGREMAFLGFDAAVRHVKAHAVHYLKQNFKAFNFFERKYNIYYSLALLENMPMFSFVPGVRIQQQEQFNKAFMNYFRGLDLGLDFDEKCLFDTKSGHTFCDKFNKDITKSVCEKCPYYDTNWEVVKQDTATIKNLFDDYSIPYQLKCSGTGFHINIEWKYLEGCMDVVPRLKRLNKSLRGEDTVVLSSWFACELCDINGLTSLDKSVFGVRRPWKSPYSLDIKSGNVALPLSDVQFEKFDWAMVKPENVLCKVRDRGLLERSGTSDNLRSFIEDFLLG